MPEKSRGVEGGFETYRFGWGESSRERVVGRQASCRTQGDTQSQGASEKSRVFIGLVENWPTNPPLAGGCGTLGSEGLKDPSKVEARNMVAEAKFSQASCLKVETLKVPYESERLTSATYTPP